LFYGLLDEILNIGRRQRDVLAPEIAQDKAGVDDCASPRALDMLKGPSDPPLDIFDKGAILL